MAGPPSQVTAVIAAALTAAGCGQRPNNNAVLPTDSNATLSTAHHPAKNRPGEIRSGQISEPTPNLSVIAATGPEPQPDPYAIAAETLCDSQASPDARLAAAGLLCDHLDEGLPLLVESLEHDGVIPLVLQAAAADPDRALGLLAADTDLDAPARVSLIQSLSQHRTPKVVRTLIGELEQDATRPAAFDTLCALTGRGDLGPDPAAWKNWHATLEGLSDQAWRDQLVTDLVARVARIDERATRAERMVIDAYRRLYLLTEPAGRPALLAELLRSEQPGIQGLGFDLAERELASNADLDSAVSVAAIDLLENSDPLLRARAARLVNRLAPPAAAGVVARVLAAETDPVAAEPLLQAAARWPSPQLVEPVLRWLGRDQTREAACQAAVALFDAGHLVGDDARERIRALLTPIPDAPSAARLILLAQAGTTADREAIAALLHHPEQTTRHAAADALARSESGAAMLIDSATRDPGLAPDILVALARHNRLEAASDAIGGIDTWDAAFERATSSGLRATIAGRILARFGDLLTPEQKSIYEAAADPAG